MPRRITVRYVDNFDEVIDDIEERIEVGIESATHSASVALAEVAKRSAPVRSGRLKRSISDWTTDNGGIGLTLSWYGLILNGRTGVRNGGWINRAVDDNLPEIAAAAQRGFEEGFNA